MNKDFAEIYSSPFSMVFDSNEPHNILRNTEGDFHLYTDVFGAGLNTGDIFVTAINYTEKELKENINTIQTLISSNMSNIVKSLHDGCIVSSERLKIITNGNIDIISNLLNKVRKYEDEEEFYQIFLQIQSDKEIIPNASGHDEIISDVSDIIQDIKIVLDETFSNKSEICSDEIVETLDLHRFFNEAAFLKHSQLIVGYSKSSKTYYFDNAEDVIIYDFNEFIRSNSVLKKCQNCGRYFFPVNRKDEKYCYYVSDGKHTCREIGYINKLNNDNIQKTYRNIYKTQNARKQRNKKNIANIDTLFDEWVNYARQQLELCKTGNITLEQMSKNIMSGNWMRKGDD